MLGRCLKKLKERMIYQVVSKAIGLNSPSTIKTTTTQQNLAC